MVCARKQCHLGSKGVLCDAVLWCNGCNKSGDSGLSWVTEDHGGLLKIAEGQRGLLRVNGECWWWQSTSVAGQHVYFTDSLIFRRIYPSGRCRPLCNAARFPKAAPHCPALPHQADPRLRSCIAPPPASATLARVHHCQHQRRDLPHRELVSDAQLCPGSGGMQQPSQNRGEIRQDSERRRLRAGALGPEPEQRPAAQLIPGPAQGRHKPRKRMHAGIHVWRG